MKSNIVSEYHKNGFAILRNFANHKILGSLSRLYKNILIENHSKPVFLWEQDPFFKDRSPKDKISKILSVHDYQEFKSFIHSEQLVEILRELIGDKIDCFLSQFVFKNPSAAGQPWHQDQYYFNFSPYSVPIGIWLPLVDVSPHNGCLSLIPKSHLGANLQHIEDPKPNANIGYHTISNIKVNEFIDLPMNKGDLLIFNSKLIHKSHSNKTETARVAAVAHFCKKRYQRYWQTIWKRY